MLSYDEFKKILKNNGYKEYDFNPAEIKYVYQWFSMQGMEYERVRDIISGARKKELWETEGKNGRVNIKLLDLIKHKCSATDIAMYEQIYAINNKFKEYYLKQKIETPHLDKLISKCLRATKKINGTVSEDALKIAEKDLNVLYNIACIYTSISEHIKNESILRRDPDQENSPLVSFARVADYIVGTRLGRMKHLEELRKPDIGKQFDEFLNELVNPTEIIPEDEIFTQEDVKEILLATTSMIRYATAEKVSSLRKVIAMYKTEIFKLANITDKERRQVAEVSAKSMLMRAGTIMEATPESIKDCVDFLLGKDMKTILEYVPKTYENEDKKKLRYVFPDLKVQGMTPEKHLYILNNNVSLFASLKMPTLYSVVSGLTDCVYQAICPDGKDLTIEAKKDVVEKAGFDTSALFTGDNLLEALNSTTATIFNDGRKKKYRENIVKNIQTLLKYVSVADMQKIMQHNYLLFISDNKKVEEKISAIIEKANGRLDAFVKEFNKYINGKFRMPVARDKTSVEEFEDEEEVDNQSSKPVDKFTKTAIKITDFNLNNLPELSVGVAINELVELTKYFKLTSKEIEEYSQKSKSSIAHSLAGARTTGYWDKPMDVEVVDSKTGLKTKQKQDAADLMNLRNLRKKREFVAKLNKLLQVCNELKSNTKDTLKEEIMYLLSNLMPLIENRIGKVKAEIDENVWLLNDTYKDDRFNKKSRNSNINLALADAEMETLWDMMSRKNSFVARILPQQVLEEGVDKLIQAQTVAKKHADVRKSALEINEHTFVLKVEHTYLTKLHQVLSQCSDLLLNTDKVEETIDTLEPVEQREVFEEDLDNEELINQIEKLQQYIKKKNSEIKAKFKNKFNEAVENKHPHAVRLNKQLNDAQAKLNILQGKLKDLNRAQGI